MGLFEFVDQLKNGVVSKRNDSLLQMLDGDEGSGEDGLGGGGVGADSGQSAQAALLSPTGSKSGALTPATPSTAARTAATSASATGTASAAGTGTTTGTTATGTGAVPDLSLPLRFDVNICINHARSPHYYSIACNVLDTHHGAILV